MEQQLVKLTAQRVHVSTKQTQSVISLLEDGNTVPFIARYRKEATGSLDEIQIKAIEEAYHYEKALQQRKEEVLRLIEEQGKLTDTLQHEIMAATILQKVEDLYRPYKQKRRTRAMMAIEKGLESLADTFMTFSPESLEEMARPYVNTELKVSSVEEALAGARDIIAERVADDASLRDIVRKITWKQGKMCSNLKKDGQDEREIYHNYYEYEESLQTIVPHRVLALNRGEKEDILKVTILFPEDLLVEKLIQKVVTADETPAAIQVKEAITDAFKRLIAPSVEREIRTELTEKAEAQAIHVFSENLKSLLLQPPLKGKVVLGIDPAFRTGCKLAVVDEIGKLLEIGVIYPHPPQSKTEQAKLQLTHLIKQYNVNLIAIGNGTASRETEHFVAQCLKEMSDPSVQYVIVNEAGASVYSASPQARAEFPSLQVEQRSAVSIARRLQDPLSELVKIDPASIGVGQYQHDVSRKKLSESLTFVVETAVNRVGVNVNTASISLLQYVAGLSKTVAENIVKLREQEGKFTKRAQLKKVPRLGAKTYEQAIGFLRIPDAENIFDATGIHPESYEIAQAILDQVGLSKKQIGSAEAKKALERVQIQELADRLQVGKVTIEDLVLTLQRPNRDPREEYPQPILRSDVLDMKDLYEGLEMQGTVRNVVDFGAFVDIGVSEDGLVHISKLSQGYVKHPLDVVSSGDIVTVWVQAVDKDKGRISLSMIPPQEKRVTND